MFGIAIPTRDQFFVGKAIHWSHFVTYDPGDPSITTGPQPKMTSLVFFCFFLTIAKFGVDLTNVYNVTSSKTKYRLSFPFGPHCSLESTRDRLQ